jgi:hypothetical protein
MPRFSEGQIVEINDDVQLLIDLGLAEALPESSSPQTIKAIPKDPLKAVVSATKKEVAKP